MCSAIRYFCRCYIGPALKKVNDVYFFQRRNAPVDLQVINRFNNKSANSDSPKRNISGTRSEPGRFVAVTSALAYFISSVLNATGGSIWLVSPGLMEKCVVRSPIRVEKYELVASIFLGSSSRWMLCMIHMGYWFYREQCRNAKVWPYAGRDSVAKEWFTEVQKLVPMMMQSGPVDFDSMCM